MTARLEAVVESVGRETAWSRRQAEAHIRAGLQFGFTLEQCEALLRMGVSPVLVAEALGLDRDPAKTGSKA